MPLSSNFFPQSTGKKNCENWSIFSEDMKKYNSLLFWPTLYIICLLYTSDAADE